MQYMKRRWTLVALLSLLATAACSPPEDTGEAASGALPAAAEALPDSLAQIEAGARSMPVISGEETLGDAIFSYQIYVADGEPAFIDESMTVGDNADIRNRMYFDDGKIVHYRREGSQLVADPPNPPGIGSVFVAVDYDDKEGIAHVTKRLGGKDAEIETYELTAIRSRLSRYRKIVSVDQHPPLPQDEYQGYLVLGHELRTFQPCGSPTVYWAEADESIRDVLRSIYDEKAQVPHQPLYARVKGAIGDRPEGEFASNYPAVFEISSVSMLRPREEMDCP